MTRHRPANPPTTPRPRHARRRGVSLIEALIATALLTLTVTAMTEALAASFHAERVARDQSAAYATASEMLELVAARPAEEPDEDASHGGTATGGSPGGGFGAAGAPGGGHGLGNPNGTSALGLGQQAAARADTVALRETRDRLLGSDKVGDRIAAVQEARLLADSVTSLRELARTPIETTLPVTTADGQTQPMVLVMTATPDVGGSYLVEVGVTPPGREPVSVSRLVFDGGAR